MAGTLKKFGEATRTSFPVTKGDHTVCVRHPRLECRPAKVAAELNTQRYMLLLEIQDWAERDGRVRSVIGFQR